MVTEITSKEIRSKHLIAKGTVNGIKTRMISTNKELTDDEIKVILEAKVPEEVV